MGNPSSILRPGQRVTGTFYDTRRTGTVIQHTVPSIVWVKWDGPRGALTWCHRESLSNLED